MEKTVSESCSEQVHIVHSEDINGTNRLFGGQLMKWIDELAAVVGRRHAGMEVVTLAVDTIRFKQPAFINDIILMQGKITYVGNTSMEVTVNSWRLKNDGFKEKMNTAHLIMVGLGEDGKTAKVPGLILQTEEEQCEWEAAEKRSQVRKERREQHF